MAEHFDSHVTSQGFGRRFVWLTVPPLAVIAMFAVALLHVILPAVEEHIIEDRRGRCRELTETAASLIDTYYQRQVDGELSADEAKRRALERIKELRYGPDGKDYFWINDYEPRMIMHPYRSHLDGQYLGDFVDKHGKRLFAEFVRVVRDSGQGFVDYYWHLHDSDSVVAKLSFVKGLEQWGWIVGTGIYMGDVRPVVSSLRIKVIWTCVAAILVVVMLSAVLSWRYLVSERKRRRAETRWRHLAESLPEIVFECDLEGRLVFCNRAAFEVTGFTRQDWSDGLHVNDLVVADQHAELHADMQRVLAGEQLADREYRLRRKSGTSFPAIIRSKPIIERGRSIGLRGIAVDITERVEIEQALRRERDFTHRLIEASPSFFIAFDSNRRVLMINRAMLEATGYTLEEVLGEDSLHHFVAEEDRPTATAVIEALANSSDPVHSELSVVTRDGRALLVEWHGRAVLDQQGNVDFIFVIGVDITEKRQMESEAMRMAQLASIGELAAGVAHEINNPITGIINYAQIVADEPSVPEAQARMSSLIVREGDRIARIVRNLLNLSRRQEGQRYPTTMSDILEVSLSLWRKQLEHDNIVLTVECPEETPAIMVDPQRIQQVFINLLSNSRYALNQRHGGAVDTKILRISCHREIDGGVTYARIEVYDNGSGMSNGVRANILSPFFTTKPAGEGTGLGMSISHGIIQEHGGRLEIDSREGEYTRITIWLPAITKSQSAEVLT